MKYFTAALFASIMIFGGLTARAAAPPVDPEPALELQFAAWADANGVVFDRLSCDVTTGEGNVCFVLAGLDVSAYIPTADGVNWTVYGADVAAAPAATLLPATTLPAIQPLVAETNVYYANCSEARAAGDAPLYRGDAGYRSALDRDDDGVDCE